MVGAEAGGPHDRADAPPAQIELERSGCAPWRRSTDGRSTRRRRAPRPLVEPVEQAVQLEVGQPAGVGERRPRTARRRRATAPSRPTTSTPELGERVEVERAPLGRADQLRRRDVAGADEVVDLVVALVEHAGGVHPPEDVAPAVGARHAHVLADGERHRAAAAVDLVGELHAGGRAADDEHAAVGAAASGDR